MGTVYLILGALFVIAILFFALLLPLWLLFDAAWQDRKKYGSFRSALWMHYDTRSSGGYR